MTKSKVSKLKIEKTKILLNKQNDNIMIRETFSSKFFIFVRMLFSFCLMQKHDFNHKNLNKFLIKHKILILKYENGMFLYLENIKSKLKTSK